MRKTTAPGLAEGCQASLGPINHGLAQRQLANRDSGLAIGVTTLLHEAYLDGRHRTEEETEASEQT